MSGEQGWTSKYNCGTFCLTWVFTEKDWYESSVLAVNEVWKLPSETVPSTSILTSLLLVGGGQRLTIVLLTWNNSSCKDVGTSPIQPSTENTITEEVRPCGSGLSQAWPSKPLRMQTTQPLWAAFSTLDCSHEEIGFPFSPVWICLILVYGHCLSCYCQAVKSLAPSSQLVGHGQEKAALRWPQSLPFSSQKQSHHSGPPYLPAWGANVPLPPPGCGKSG